MYTILIINKKIKILYLYLYTNSIIILLILLLNYYIILYNINKMQNEKCYISYTIVLNVF